MSEEVSSVKPQEPRTKVVHRTSASVPVYGLGFVGALVYYLQHATTFWIGVVGVLKAMVWPAMLIYKVLETLKM